MSLAQLEEWRFVTCSDWVFCWFQTDIQRSQVSEQCGTQKDRSEIQT
jgi:hypothetical protein